MNTEERAKPTPIPVRGGVRGWGAGKPWLPRLARTARGPFSVLQPDRILVTRKEAINPLFSTPDVTAFMADLEQRDIDFVIVDESTVGVRPWNILSSLVNYMLI